MTLLRLIVESYLMSQIHDTISKVFSNTQKSVRNQSQFLGRQKRILLCFTTHKGTIAKFVLLKFAILFEIEPAVQK